MLKPFHLFTVDVEDWPQSALDHTLPVGDRVVASTCALLDLLAEAGVRATFFVLGKVAEAHPGLARKIADAGHEIGTHGYSHESLHSMPDATFREELHRSVETLREQTAQPVSGHRAADFSISSRSLHLLEHLGEEGLLYDSSIFPIRHPRYGMSAAWRYPHKIRCASGLMLTEFPIATIRFSRMVLPGAGGGYLRLFPFWWTDLTMRRLGREGAPATCYFHPYELDVTEMEEIPHRVPFLFRWSQSANRRTVRSKLRRLLSTHRFVTMGEAYKSLNKYHLELALDLGKAPALYRPEPKPKPTRCFSPAI
jgi:polysaccharide deacetylase family protein (PEP-CTERM system associated)